MIWVCNFTSDLSSDLNNKMSTPFLRNVKMLGGEVVDKVLKHSDSVALD